MLTALFRDSLQDLRFALRQFRRAPGFAAVAIATLALAIGCAAAVFSVLDATVVRPLPYNEPDRIVDLQTYSPRGYTQPASWPQYLDYRRESSSLLTIAGYNPSSANLQAGGSASPVHVVDATDGFFNVFGVEPLLGRTFLPGEEQTGRNEVVVLSYELWQSAFGGRPNVLGSAIRIDGVPNTVIGIMPAGFRFPLTSVDALYRPYHVPQTVLTRRDSHFLPLLARLKPGVTLSVAQGGLQHLFDDLGRTYPNEAGRRLKLRTLTEATLGNTAPALRTLTLAVLGVLLIGCVNIAGLLLARGVSRGRELSLRSALGANRSRIVRQILAEAAMLALAGAAAGILLAAALLRAIRQLLIHSLARGAEVHLNLPVLAITVLVAVGCALAAGAYPSLRLSRVAPAQALRSGGSAGSSRAQTRVRGLFIAIQVALALCLLVCSSLLLRNLHSLRGTQLGFSPQNLLTTELYLTAENYKDRDLLAAFYAPLLDRVRAIPGVTGAGVINLVPILESGSNSDVQIVGEPPAPPNEETLAENRVLVPGTLETFGARLIAGRMLSNSLDRADTPVVLTVNQAFVRKFFSPGEDPVGRIVKWGPTNVPIVGVTSDLRQNLYGPPLAEMDLSAAQMPPAYAKDELTRLNLVVRSAVPPQSIVPQLRAALHATDAAIPFRTPETMNGIVAETLTFERLEGWLFGIFAALALTLSLVGIYGTVSHEVELRTRDIGVRMALGSTRGRVAGGILTRISLLMAGGLAAGWLLTLALRRVLAAVVELHAAQDAILLLAITVLLGLCGIAASLWPAHRASSINPTEALRAE